MTTDEGFFADIRDNPGDDLPRLAYADWLEENGDETDRKRAELIRLHCRIQEAKAGDPGREGLLQRAAGVVEELKQTWFVPLNLHADHWRIGRGFVEAVVVRAPQFAAHGESMARLAPVAEITVVFTAVHAAALAACPALRHVRRLEARGGGLRDDVLRALADSPHAPRPEALVLDSGGVTASGVRELLRLDLSRLRLLSLGSNGLQVEGVGLLCGAALGRLESLYLGSNALRVESARALAAAPLRQLAVLSLGWNFLDDEAIETLAGSANLANVRRLDVRRNTFGRRGALALARSTHLRSLTDIDASGNDLGAEGRMALSDRFGERATL